MCRSSVSPDHFTKPPVRSMPVGGTFLIRRCYASPCAQPLADLAPFVFPYFSLTSLDVLGTGNKCIQGGYCSLGEGPAKPQRRKWLQGIKAGNMYMYYHVYTFVHYVTAALLVCLLSVTHQPPLFGSGFHPPPPLLFCPFSQPCTQTWRSWETTWVWPSTATKSRGTWPWCPWPTM